MLPGPTVGREQRNRRPGLIVSGHDYLANMLGLAIVVPMTSISRPLRTHVPVKCPGLSEKSWAMTEQVRAISRERIRSKIGRAENSTLVECRTRVGDFLDL